MVFFTLLKVEEPSDIRIPDEAIHPLLREMIPDNLQRFDGVRPRLSVTFRKHGEHARLVKH